jgi:hypothetical protein
VIVALMTMVLLPLLMRRRLCCRQDDIVSLITMALLPLIRDGVVDFVVIVLLPSSSWRYCPHCNGVVVIINVIALVTCRQAGIVAVDAQASLPLLQWQLLRSSQWRHCHC